MRTISDQRGIAVVAVFGVLLVLGIIGFAGYKVTSKDSAVKTSTDSSLETASDAPIKSTADVDAATKELDGISESEVDDSTLDAELDAL